MYSQPLTPADKALWYQVSDLAWGHLCALLGREQAPPRPELVYNEEDTFGWHMETHDKLSYTPGMSKAINKLRIAIPDIDQWIDFRDEAYRKHDSFFIAKFAATIYDTREEPKRSRKLHLSSATRSYLLQIAQHLKVKSMGKRTTETGLCSAMLEAIGLGTIRPNLPHPEQRQSLGDMLKPIKLTPTRPEERPNTKPYLTPKEIARQALINVGVDPEAIERYGFLADSPLIKDNTPSNENE